jgi:fatty acid desaturase
MAADIRTKVEWPTLAMLALTYAMWMLGTLVWEWSAIVSIVIVTLAVTQFSSLQHEVLHGHPFANQKLNEALVFPALTLFVPYERFRDLHLQHHMDPNLTDPYDDPEANFLDPEVWSALSGVTKRVLRINNTLLGRMILGPIISTYSFVTTDWVRVRAGDAEVARAWLLNAVGVGLVMIWLVFFTSMPILGYCLAAYFGYGILKIRTFLEHRAHEAFRARSVVVEDRGPLALLFLNNNYHVVHHCSPQVAWYRLPALYAEKRDYYLRRNDAYVYKNYLEIFRLYFFKAKDDLPHPIWPVRKS